MFKLNMHVNNDILHFYIFSLSIKQRLVLECACTKSHPFVLESVEGETGIEILHFCSCSF